LHASIRSILWTIALIENVSAIKSGELISRDDGLRRFSTVCVTLVLATSTYCHRRIGIVDCANTIGFYWKREA